MNSEKKHGEFTLDQIIAKVRAEDVDPQEVEQAADRVWARIAAASPSLAAVHEGAHDMGHDVEQIRGCADFQALIPAYLAKTLPEARALLFQDHVLECVACRHALNHARSGARTATPQAVKFAAKPGRASRTTGWAIAAVLLLVGIGIGLVATNRWFGGTQAAVQSVDGSLYQVSDRGGNALATGHVLLRNQELRTAKASSAVLRLVDGSLVEMGERADLWLSRGWRGSTIHLERGKIIVRAAGQRYGRLYVATPDCLVAVKGTIFAVDTGMKGARISVIQGEVQVTEAGKAKLLRSGEQLTTRAAVAQVPLKQEISWSRNSGEYLALLSEFAGLEKQLDALPGPPLRYDSTLLKMVPENTVFYAGIPNIGSTFSEANRLLQERIQQSEVLEAWWKQQQASGKAQKIQEMTDRIRNFSDYLGNEIVIALPQGQESPILLAEVKRPDFGAFLESQLGQLNTGGPAPQVVSNAAAIMPGAKGQPLILLRNNILAVTTDAQQLQKVANLIDHAGSSEFAATPFYAAIRQAYQGGAGWLLCADMEQILAHSVRQGEARGQGHAGKKGVDLFENENAGLADTRYLIIQSKDVDGQTQNRATLTFAKQRRGIVSWLAAPGPMGTLDFISPNASFTISIIVKDPRKIVQDILSFMQDEDPSFGQKLADFEAETGVSIEDDVAGSLGGEATFALDGPVLPTPSWKVALEVTDATRLQGAIEKLVTGANQESQTEGKDGHLTLTQHTVDGRTYYDLQLTPPTSQSGKPSPAPTDINYVYVDGYLLAAPSLALLTSSIQNRETGYSLPRSSEFTSRLPRDGYTNFSGLVYQNLWGALAPIADQLKSTAALTPAQRQAIDALGQNNAPSLICAYGESDRILVANAGSFFGIGFESLLGAGHAGPLDVLRIIGSASR